MMKRRDVVMVGVSGLAGLSAVAVAAGDPVGTSSLPPSAGAATARLEVEARLGAQRDAWNRGDLDAFCADYADDAVFLSPSGLTRGRAEVLARYRKKYGSARSTMGTLSFDTIDVVASIDVVTMAMRWQLTWPDQPGAAGLTLITWVKRGSRWLLAQDASM